MGFFDRLFGTQQPEPQQQPRYAPQPRTARTDDEIAVERYRYLLRTAPPEAIEQAHEEAFSKLTPEQRRLLFQQLSADAAPGDAPRGDDPHSLAQSATRSELRQPGTMERTMTGPSFGSMVGSSLLGTVAGYFIASAVVGRVHARRRRRGRLRERRRRRLERGRGRRFRRRCERRCRRRLRRRRTTTPVVTSAEAEATSAEEASATSAGAATSAAASSHTADARVFGLARVKNHPRAADSPAARQRWFGSVEQQRRLLDDARDVGQEAAGDIAVDHAVVEARAERRDEPRAHLAVDDPRLLLDRAERDDRRPRPG